jgi:hypothetical protein
MCEFDGQAHPGFNQTSYNNRALATLYINVASGPGKRLLQLLEVGGGGHLAEYYRLM